MEHLFGILSINKPRGRTSRDVVNHVQRLARPNKVGHAGTLDPLARGVLLVCLGQATRLVPYLQQQTKQYRGTFQLGLTSDTEDTEGEVTVIESAHRPHREEIMTLLPQFCGTIQQRPPAYSALKVKGRRAYDLARQGETVVLTERPVFVETICLVEYEYPQLILDITCGSGTYIRSLGRDIGEALGTGAVMSDLERTAIGKFQLQSACSIDHVTAQSLPQLMQPARTAVAHLPQVVLDEQACESIRHGREIAADALSPPQHHADNDAEVAAVNSQGHLVAILMPGHDCCWRPLRTFAQPANSR